MTPHHRRAVAAVFVVTGILLVVWDGMLRRSRMGEDGRRLSAAIDDLLA